MNQKSHTNILLVNKPVGATPLQSIKSLQEHKIIESAIVGYAGRLDPMASGLLLLLLNEENKNRALFEKLPKVYECEILLEVGTDTFDLLGLVVETGKLAHPAPSETITKHLTSMNGSFVQPYPPFSSPRVRGKPLWQWAREKRLSEITIPAKEVHIFDTKLLSIRKVTAASLFKNIERKVSLVTSEDFRQEEILTSWKGVLAKPAQSEFTIIQIQASVSSGTYMRSIARGLGSLLHAPACAYSITRIKIGNINLDAVKKYKYVTRTELFA